VIIPTKDYKLYASEYVQGCVKFIGEKIAVSRTEKQTMIDSCIETYNTNLESVGANSDNQNLVYLSALQITSYEKNILFITDYYFGFLL